MSLATLPIAGQARAYKAPRTADGKPNLNGIWQAMNEANWDIQAHAAAPGPVRSSAPSSPCPPGLGIVEGGRFPYKPEALAKKKENSREPA